MKKILFVLFILLPLISTKAQDIAALVVTMPDNMTIGVTLDQKKELAVAEPDSIEKKVFVINAVGDSIERLAYSDDYFKLKTSDAGTLEIKLLPLVNNTNIVGVITTVCGDVCDSRIDFYTTSWQPLDKSTLFPEINKESFLKKDIDRNSPDYKNASAPVDMTPLKYSFSENDKNITVEYQLENYLAADDYKAMKPYLITQPKVFEWNKFAYKEKATE